MTEHEKIEVFKVCWECGTYFPARLHSFNPYCPDHQGVYENQLIPRIKRERYVNAEYLDVYNNIPYFPHHVKTKKEKSEYLQKREYWMNNGFARQARHVQVYERACRSCGGRLLTKDGKYNPLRRECGKPHDDPVQYLNWSTTKDDYMYDLWEKQGKRYKYFYESSIFYKASIPEKKRVIQCEDCGQEFRFHQVTVHHVIEVNQLTAENIMLIWDHSNLLALCDDCHYKKRHGWLEPAERKEFNRKKKIEKIKKKHGTLDKFF